MGLCYYFKKVFKCHLNVSHSSVLETKPSFPHVGIQELLKFLSFKNCTHHYAYIFAKQVFGIQKSISLESTDESNCEG